MAAGRLLHTVGIEVLRAIALPVGLLFLAALAATVVQHKPVLSFEKLQPKFDAISPLKGLRNKFSLRTLLELVKNLLKIGVVGAAVMGVVWPRRSELLQLHAVDLPALLPIVKDIAVAMLIAVVIAMTVIAAADYFYQWWERQRNLRMSLQDIKDEHKDSEGDPHVKARIRKVRQDRANKRMLAQVPLATVVVTNPTHFAVALRYAPEDNMNAPVVVAKGADLIAAKIREVAKENKVPLVENPPLARALYASAEVDQEIPVEHFKAVAEVISYVLRIKKPRGAGAPRGARPKRRAGAGARGASNAERRPAQ
jgi:flagellar biosynthetic protein FlhB